MIPVVGALTGAGIGTGTATWIGVILRRGAGIGEIARTGDGAVSGDGDDGINKSNKRTHSERIN
jgi:hypothetical protein